MINREQAKKEEREDGRGERGEGRGETWAMEAKMAMVQAYLTSIDNTVALVADPESNWIPCSYDEAMM